MHEHFFLGYAEELQEFKQLTGKARAKKYESLFDWLMFFIKFINERITGLRQLLPNANEELYNRINKLISYSFECRKRAYELLEELKKIRVKND